MSAFLMSQEALSNLAYEFLRLHHDGEGIRWANLPEAWGFRELPQDGRFERIFQILLAENLRSLRSRYGSRTELEQQMCRDWKALQPSTGYMTKEVDAAGVVNLCGCFDYQACETSDYSETAAALIIKMTRDAAYRAAVKKAGTKAEWGEPLEGFSAEE